MSSVLEDQNQKIEIAKAFVEQDKRWGGPRYVGLGAITLFICITAIYLMSTTQGCSLQIVP